jgi:hypothetical protein
VVQVGKDLQGVGDDFVGFPALHIDHEADAAGVVLERGIIEALLPRRASRGNIGLVVGLRVGGGIVVHGLGKVVGFGGVSGATARKAQKKGRLVICESGPGCVMCGELSASVKRSGSF